MADDSGLDKLKEKYLDEIVSVLPLSQVFFIVLMAVVAEQLIKGTAKSVFTALQGVGLKETLGPEGKLWDISVVILALSAFAAIINVSIRRFLNARSIKSPGIYVAIQKWQRQAATLSVTMSEVERSAALDSLKAEVELRLKRYRTHKLTADLCFSLLMVQVFSLVLIFGLILENGGSAVFDRVDAFSFLLVSIFSVVTHRAAIKYALTQVFPLKVFVSVLNAELVFIEGIS